MILTGQVVAFLRRYLRDNWDLLRSAEFKDPAFGFLMTLEKAERASPGLACRSAPSRRNYHEH